MKYIKQFLIILGISFAGELLKMLLPFPVPASIYGMVLLFAGLLSGVIRLDAVKETGTFLIEIMPVMFIPAGVGLMTSLGTLKAMLVPVSIVTVVTILTVMLATGRISQSIIRRTEEKKHE
ncbi:MAG: CidA/LrgA family protein [Lachnospiraceae bacterium]|nr:CidA/LrgA family protein [Lachnospiraceae bacterium]